MEEHHSAANLEMIQRQTKKC